MGLMGTGEHSGHVGSASWSLASRCIPLLISMKTVSLGSTSADRGDRLSSSEGVTKKPMWFLLLMWLQVSLGKRKPAEQETSFCLKQLLTIWPISFQASLIQSNSPSVSCFFTLFHKHFSISCYTIYLICVWDSPMATWTAACYSDFRSLCTTEGSKWGGWKWKANNKMLMKTPSPQIVSVHSIVSFEAFFLSVIKTSASWNRGAHSGSSRSCKSGKEKAKKVRLHHQMRRPRRGSNKVCLRGFENPQPLGHHSLISRYSSSHPSSHMPCEHSTKPYSHNLHRALLLPFSTHWALSLPRKGSVFHCLSSWCHQTRTTVAILSEEIP